jgi:hypothetical protein
LVGVFTAFLATVLVAVLTAFLTDVLPTPLVGCWAVAFLATALVTTTFLAGAFLVVGFTDFEGGLETVWALVALIALVAVVGFFALSAFTNFVTLFRVGFLVTTFLVTFFEASAFFVLVAVMNMSPFSQLLI